MMACSSRPHSTTSLAKARLVCPAQGHLDKDSTWWTGIGYHHFFQMNSFGFHDDALGGTSDPNTLHARYKDSHALALFLPAATAGVRGSNDFCKHSLPSGLEGGSSDRYPHNWALNTTDHDDPLHGSQPQIHGVATAHARAQGEAAADPAWGPAGAGGSPGPPAIGEASPCCCENAWPTDGVHLSEVLHQVPVLVSWASPGAEVATEQPKVPSRAGEFSLAFESITK